MIWDKISCAILILIAAGCLVTQLRQDFRLDKLRCRVDDLEFQQRHIREMFTVYGKEVREAKQALNKTKEV